MQRVVTVIQIPGNTAGLVDIRRKDNSLSVSAEQVTRAREAFETGPRILASAKEIPDGDYVQVDERTYPFAVGPKRATALAALAIEDSEEFLDLDNRVKRLLLAKAAGFSRIVSFDDTSEYPLLRGFRNRTWGEYAVQQAAQAQLDALVEEGGFDAEYLIFRRGAEIFPYTFVREGNSSRMVGPPDLWVQLSAEVEIRPGALPQSIPPVLRATDGPYPPVGYLVIGFWKQAPNSSTGALQVWATFVSNSREFDNNATPNLRLPVSMPSSPPSLRHFGVAQDGYMKMAFRKTLEGSGVSRVETVEAYYPDNVLGHMARKILSDLFPYIKRYVYVPGGGPSPDEQQALIDQLNAAKAEQTAVRDVVPGETFEEEVVPEQAPSSALPFAAAAGLVGYFLLRRGE